MAATVQSYTISIGAGGAGCTWYPYTGNNGGDSTALGYTAVGGGAGTGMDQYGNNGGSGGADGYPSGGMRGGAAAPGQGNLGNRTFTGSAFNGGGGGGAGSAGSSMTGGFPLTTWAGTFGGGGGGGFGGGAGGGAGAGNGGYQAGAGGHAAANTGSGGGGGGNMDAFGGNGGSGKVVIRYINNPPPTVSWHTQDMPPSPLHVGTTFTARATGSDSGNLGGVWVEYSVNGGAWIGLAWDDQVNTGGDGYAITTNGNPIVAGPPGATYLFKCLAWDQGGANSGWQYSATYTVANRAPTTALSVSPTSIFFGQSATVSSSAADLDGNLTFHGVLALFQDASNWYRSPTTDHSTGWGNHSTSADFVSASYTSGVASGSSSSRSVVHRPSWAGTITYHADSRDVYGWQSSTTPTVYAYLTVNKATPNATFAAKSFTGTRTLTAGDLDATFANPYSTAVAAPSGTITYNYPVGSVLTPGSYNVIATYSGNSNYEAKSISAIYSVSKITPTITWNFPAAVTYGTPLSGTQLNATASVPGSFAYNPAAGSVIASGAQTLSVTFTPTDTTSYATATKTVPLTVNQAPLTIKANDASKTFGAANPTFSATYTGFVNGDTSSVVTGLALTTTATASSPVATYPITPSGASTANYLISYQTGTLTVTAGGQVVTLTRGSTSVTTGNTGSTSTTTFALVTFTASSGSSGLYTWRIDGVTQGATGTILTTSFSTAGTHTVSAAAAAGGSYAASAPATFNVSVSAGNVWTVSTGQSHAIALKSDGTVLTWGGNSSGQLGDGTTTTRTAPAAVSGLTGVVAIAAGGNHSIAVKSDGTVWSWGANGSGQLGDGTVSNRLTPVQATSVSGIVDVVAGATHTIALKNDGSAWSWGSNASGQLGDGTTTQRNSPVQINSLANITALAAGSNHSLAVKSDGTVWGWGKNDNRQTGDGTTTNRLTPGQVPGLTAVLEVAGGASHTMALKTDGTVWAWGSNFSGQIGDGTTTERATPTQASGLTGMVSIAAGGDHSVAVKSDGTVRAWGKNALGQVGDGTTTNRSTSVAVNGLASIVAAAAGTSHTFAVKTDGTVYSWGGDGFGSATIANQRINLASLRLTPDAADADQDAMPDSLETQYFGNLTRAGSADHDGDGLIDVQELYLGSDPTKTDTDGDATSDLNDPYPADYYNNAAPSIVILGGNNQTTAAGQFNAAAFDLAIATNPGSLLLVNAPVTLTVTAGGGSLASTNLPGATLSTSLSLRSDGAGTVRSYYKQPFLAGVSSQIKVVAGQTQLFLATSSSTAANTPPAPASLVSVAVTSSSVNLFWNTSDATNVAGYNIYRNGSLIGTTSGTGTYFTDHSLSGSTAYSYTVQAFNGAGVLSAQSTAATATTVATTTPSLEIFTPLK